MFIAKRTTIEIDIDNVNVDKRYFNFDFTISVDGEEKLKSSYNDDYDGEDKKEMKRLLEDGYAVQLVLKNYTLEYV